MSNKQMALQQSIQQHLLVQPRTFFSTGLSFSRMAKGGKPSVCCSLVFNNVGAVCFGEVAWVDTMFDAYTRPKVVVVVLVYQQFVYPWADYFPKSSGCCFCPSFHWYRERWNISRYIMQFWTKTETRSLWKKRMQMNCRVCPQTENKGDISAMLCYTSEKSSCFCGYFFEHEFCSIV